MFDQVDKDFKKTMKITYQSPLAIKVANRQAVLEQFRRSNKMLEEIQRGLQNFLESKRRGFPRFYFLSDDELLQILANSADAS